MAAPLADAERVWAFWFGGAVEESFRTKWFPASSVAAQAAADADVEAQFGGLLAAALRGAWWRRVALRSHARRKAGRAAQSNATCGAAGAAAGSAHGARQRVRTTAAAHCISALCRPLNLRVVACARLQASWTTGARRRTRA